MSQNLISLTLSSADETALDEALATLERIFAPFITLTPAQARALLKMGDKSEPFCRQTVMVLEQNQGIVPPGFDFSEMKRDLVEIRAEAKALRSEHGKKAAAKPKPAPATAKKAG